MSLPSAAAAFRMMCCPTGSPSAWRGCGNANLLARDSVSAGTQNTASGHELPAGYTTKWCSDSRTAGAVVLTGHRQRPHSAGTAPAKSENAVLIALHWQSSCYNKCQEALGKEPHPQPNPPTRTVPHHSQSIHLNRRVLCVSSFLSTSGSCFQVSGSRNGGGWRGRSAKAATIADSTMITAAATSASPPSIACAASKYKPAACARQSVLPPTGEEVIHRAVSIKDELLQAEQARLAATQQAQPASNKARWLHMRARGRLNTLKGSVWHPKLDLLQLSSRPETQG